VAVALTRPDYWSARDTSPSEIEAALLAMMHERRVDGMLQAPARVLNLVVVVGSDGREEISRRLDATGRETPARTILVSIADERPGLDAVATLVHDTPDALGGNTVFRERIEIECGAQQLDHIDSIVGPLLATEVGTVIWSPDGHAEAVDAMDGIASDVLVDSLEFPDWRQAIARLQELSERMEVTDLAWLRSTPWRERVAAAFDPPRWRSQLDAINRVVVRIEPDSTMAALLFVGWLAARLQWQVHVLEADSGGTLSGQATGPAGRIEIAFQDDATMPVPGLAGLSIETSSGLSLDLNRASGGLRAVRMQADGSSSQWTVIGASRGEDGILAHGLAHGTLPDDLFRPALEAACGFGGRASIKRSRSAEG
jgi:glucose-6-phosphate dehydrogenase assembly protein OpcA